MSSHCHPRGAPSCIASGTLIARCALALRTGSGTATCLLPADEGMPARRLIGYSCRMLFHCLLEVLLSVKPDLVIGVTAIQHTSFQKIIESLVKPDRIHILELDSTLSAVRPPQRPCDVLVVTHVFGQDLDLSSLNESVRAQPGEPPLVVEDRCQGGSLRQRFSHDCVDISINSMGMDKRPSALGGGYADVRTVAIPFGGRQLWPLLVERVDALPQERPSERAMTLLKCVPYWLGEQRPCMR